MATIPCVCPLREGQTRHPEGDTINLRNVIDTPSALAMRWRIMQLKSEDPDAEAYQVLGVMSELYLLFGVESWTLLDEDDKPLPVTKAHIRRQLLDPERLAQVMPLVDEADAKYLGIVIGPLADPASTSSPPTPTAGSTSAQTASTPTPLRRSKRSSTSTTPTDDTGTTIESPDGDSSSSPNTATAA